MVCVVIPYFQREPGILVRALRSVCASREVDDVMVIVVDDQSPIPARREIEALGRARFEIRLIEIDNLGPGGARNAGLDAVPADTRHVAFLDSDDTWTPTHLANALAALRAGFDVYFSDIMQLGAEVSAFRRADRISPANHPSIAGRDDLHAYVGDMFDQIVTGNVIGTPAVVYDFSKFGRLRFRTDLAAAGEDYLFWIELARRQAAFAFSESVEVICGRGVNVYAGSGWGTDRHALRVADELTYRFALLKHFDLTAGQRQHVLAAVGKLREALVRDVLHRLRHRKPIDWPVVLRALRRDPRLLAQGAETLSGMIISRVRPTRSQS